MKIMDMFAWYKSVSVEANPIHKRDSFPLLNVYRAAILFIPAIFVYSQSFLLCVVEALLLGSLHVVWCLLDIVALAVFTGNFTRPARFTRNSRVSTCFSYVQIHTQIMCGNCLKFERMMSMRKSLVHCFCYYVG